MRSRSEKVGKWTKGECFVVPGRLLPQIRAAAAVMGFSEQDVVRGGIVLYCTYILNRLQPGLDFVDARGKERPNWTSEEVVSALASRCVLVRKRRLESSGRRRVAGGQSEITCVGSVLRSLAGEKAKRGSGRGRGGG
jgi:hypothetical protein